MGVTNCHTTEARNISCQSELSGGLTGLGRVPPPHPVTECSPSQVGQHPGRAAEAAEADPEAADGRKWPLQTPFPQPRNGADVLLQVVA